MAIAMKKANIRDANVVPRWHAHAKEIQKYGSVIEDMPHPLRAGVRAEMVARLNQLLADSISIRDMYQKHHWQVSGPTFDQLHLLFDKHFAEQLKIIDIVAERIQMLGGVSIAMGGDVAELTNVQPPPRGREEVPVQISRLLEAHKVIMQACLDLAEAAAKVGDQGTNDLVVGDVLRPNELQSWFLSQHLVEMPLVFAK
ncbi:MAG: DNA starvation/stationary phase protection protein [Edaphobacter sp.]